MPTRYKRKQTAKPRKQWREEHLVAAIRAINSGEMGVNEASATFGVPSRTLRRRKKSGITRDLPLGPEGCLGTANEKRLVKHVQKLEKCGFALDRESLRFLAYQFAEKLKIKHRFNRETQLAGYDWLNSFLLRNQEVSIRAAQGLSIARAEGMDRKQVNDFFNLLKDVYTEYNMFVKPSNIFNMDETGFQINNEPGKVIATKGAKDVHVLSSSERGENVTIIACCNAEGNFMPPVVIFKGVREKQEFQDGLPPGSKVFMNKKSSYITSDLFLRWLQEHFVPKMPPGPNILILDGHSSHRNSLDMLEFAEQNQIILICLPSHTTQAIQPLDRSYFGPLKHYLKKEARQWVINHPGRRLTRLQVGKIIGSAWGKAANVETGVSGFRATGIFPLNPAAIPDHFYHISDNMRHDIVNSGEKDCPLLPTLANAQSDEAILEEVSAEPVPCSSTMMVPEIGQSKETPSKYLEHISPVPVLPKTIKKRKKQSAEILTKPKPQSKTNIQDDFSDSDDEPLTVHIQKSQKSSSTSIDTSCAKDSEPCIECWENYYTTTSKADWLKCVGCHKWLHETCTIYGDSCISCGREKVRAANLDRAKKKIHL